MAILRLVRLLTSSFGIMMFIRHSLAFLSIRNIRRHHIYSALSKFYCTTAAKSDDSQTAFPSIDYTNYQWDLKGLKSEVSRVYLRTFKKVAALNEKLSNESKRTKWDTENSVQSELQNLQCYLASVGDLENQLKDIRNVNDKQFPSIAKSAIDLEIGDKPPIKQDRGVKSKTDKKSPIPGPRKPYYPYKSFDNIIIRVGREAPDNDMLSTSPKLRDPNHWWLHVSGMPGSHVVIRSVDDNLPSIYPETLRDAALLAAVNSKASNAGKVTVNYCRCRNVSKPSGAKAGLVYLNGEVSTIGINMKAESVRLERLLQSKGMQDEEDPPLFGY